MNDLNGEKPAWLLPSASSCYVWHTRQRIDTVSNKPWRPTSWRERPVHQQPDWPDPRAHDQAIKKISTLPPLVFADEIRKLREALSEVAGGRAFLLQAGDCAESFADWRADAIRDKLKLILQMALVLTYGTGVPVVKVGRIAGQFAKPRSVATEHIDGVELPAFRGHIVHDDAPTPQARRPDPQRLILAYYQATSTLNMLRALTTGGFAGLSQVHLWNQDFVTNSPEGRRYEAIAGEIGRALGFMTACGIDLTAQAALNQVDFWTSHEALILPWEEALTRRDSVTGGWYDCSAHLLWVGERTRQPDGAHVEFARGVDNPVAVKLGPATTPATALEICSVLDPQRTPGRLTFISRMGAARIRSVLPPLLTAVREAGYPVVWACDPMHGNTYLSESGYKRRRFESVLAEIDGFFGAHAEAGTWAGGVHVELTGEDVTECIGPGDDEDELFPRYTTICDPRLNASQSLALAFHLAGLLRR
jgi:3-deoxy-7-phosphoheptulonate synthase